MNIRLYLDLTDLKDKYILHDTPLEKKRQKYIYIWLFAQQGQMTRPCFFLKFYDIYSKLKCIHP